MEKIDKRVFRVHRVIELYEEDGMGLTTEQAEKILAFSQKLVNIVATHYRTADYTVYPSTNPEEIL